ncbi:hypothetical protein GDO86_004112, partial [Hymenochirus boettgeri]
QNINIHNVPTTGASWTTAQSDPLHYAGIPASEHMAQRDLEDMDKYKLKINSVARQTGMPAAVIAGISSRESRAGRLLNKGWGDGGNAFGIMQIDKRWHTPIGTWDSEEHFLQATRILIDMYQTVSRKYSGWTREQHLKGAIAAYNAGAGRIKSFEEVDSHTTGQDYSNDVVARAQFYARHGY